MPLTNALTIDVDDDFHAHALDAVVRPAAWETLAPRGERNTYRVLDMHDRVPAMVDVYPWEVAWAPIREMFAGMLDAPPAPACPSRGVP